MHKDMPYSAEALAALKSAGWSTGRKFDLHDYERKLKTFGIEPVSKVKIFLAEFGGLEIPVDTASISICLDIDRVLSVVTKRSIEAFEIFIKSTLCPVGLVGDNILMMSDSGAIYEGNTHTMAWILWGQTIEVALNNLVTGQGLENLF